jgi:hypothetical protein
MFKNLTRNALAIAAGAAMFGPSANAFVVNDTFAGNWADVSGGSRGLIIDVLENRAPARDFAPAILVEWFTYDENGDPLWLISDTQSINPNTNTVTLEFLEFAGGAFASPDQGNAQGQSWGTATLQFNSCDEAVLTFDGDNGNGTSTFSSTTESSQCVVDEVFDSCPDFATPGSVPGSCNIGGGAPITDDIVLTNETLWLVRGQFVIGDGGSVTIEPNTELVGGTLGDTDTFIVAQGGQAFVEGTVENPVVMRGNLAAGRGEWGGVVVNGSAPINGCAEGTAVCTAQGEGNSGTYGGNDPEDNSGIFRYLIVANAGIEFNEENELNGIAFQGVGRGTTIEYVQVHLNSDDGIEFFGGTANAKRIVLTGIGDDSLDWTQGWNGSVQYLIAKQYTDDGDQGIEGDNNGDANDSLPRALPVIANATFIGAQDTGWLIREGTGVSIANSIVTGFGDECIDIDQLSTFDNFENLTFFNNIIGNCGGGAFADNETNDGVFNDPFAVSTFILDQPGNVQAEPQLMNYIPMSGSPALNVAPVPFADSFFDNVNYAGAVPSQGDDWTKGWTVGLDRDAP